jgi:hypothetical protein
VLKFQDNPPALSLGPAASVRDVAGTWWVAHTKARFEKAFAADLAGRDIHYFLPYIERVRFSGGRNRRLLIPLFKSYVFFCGGDGERHAALKTGRLCQVIPVHDQGRFISEIAALEQAVRNGVPLHPYMGIAVGRRCRVTAGPMENLCGVVIRVASTAHVVMEVKMLGQGALLELNPELLEPVDALEPAADALALAR